MADHIRVHLDPVSQAALRVLTADGTSVNDAVCRAITEAAEGRAVLLTSHTSQVVRYTDRETYLAAQVAAAPPLTEYQRYVLTALLVEGRRVWLSEAQWLALHQSGPAE